MKLQVEELGLRCVEVLQDGQQPLHVVVGDDDGVIDVVHDGLQPFVRVGAGLWSSRPAVESGRCETLSPEARSHRPAASRNQAQRGDRWTGEGRPSTSTWLV